MKRKKNLNWLNHLLNGCWSVSSCSPSVFNPGCRVGACECICAEAKCQTVAGWHLTWPVSQRGNVTLCGHHVSEASSSLAALALQPDMFTCTQSLLPRLISCPLSVITIVFPLLRLVLLPLHQLCFLCQLRTFFKKHYLELFFFNY